MSKLPSNNRSPESTWRKIVSNYQNPDIRRSIWQLVNTLVPYLVLWVLMIYAINISYWYDCSSFSMTVGIGPYSKVPKPTISWAPSWACWFSLLSSIGAKAMQFIMPLQAILINGVWATFGP